MLVPIHYRDVHPDLYMIPDDAEVFIKTENGKLINIFSIKPLDENLINNLASTVKGIVTQSKLTERKKILEQAVDVIKVKADSVLGPGKLDKYIKEVGLSEV